MHILNNSWIGDFWYGFIVLIGLVICIIYYVHHKKKAFRQSLLLLLSLCLFSFTVHHFEEPNLTRSLFMKGLSGIEENDFGTSPDYIGKVVKRAYELIRKFL